MKKKIKAECLETWWTGGAREVHIKVWNRWGSLLLNLRHMVLALAEECSTRFLHLFSHNSLQSGLSFSAQWSLFSDPDLTP